LRPCRNQNFQPPKSARLHTLKARREQLAGNSPLQRKNANLRVVIPRQRKEIRRDGGPKFPAD
jgi:hypothetical protein